MKPLPLHPLLLVTALALGCAGPSRSEGPGQEAAPSPEDASSTPGEVHAALVETWLPASELSQPEREARDALIAPLKRAFLASPLKPDLEQLASGALPFESKGVGVLARLKERGFARLSPAERDAVFAALFASADPAARAMARRVRGVYLGALYGKLGPALVRDPTLEPIPPSEVEVPALDLPEGRLRYDPARRLLTHREGPIEFLIVGSGPAGSVLANRLTLAGKRVVLVERGPLVIPGAIDTRSRPELMELRNRRSSHDGAIVIRNGSAVGGGTTVNIDLAFDPTSPRLMERIQGWVQAGRLDAARYSPAALRQAYAWVQGRLGTRELDEGEINRNNRVLWEGARARGVEPSLYHLNRYRPSASPTPVDNKISALRGLLVEALEREANPLSLLPDSEVTRVLFAGERALGVEVRARAGWEHPAVVRDPQGLGIPPGTTYRIEAERVVLSAGSLGSPTILLRSGVDGPAIGAGLVLHPSVPLVGELEETIDASRGLTASVFVDAHARAQGYLFEAMPGLPAYVAMLVPGNGRDVLARLRAYRRMAGFGVMLIDTPHAENRVRLHEGQAVVDYRIHAADAARFRAGVAEAARTLFAAGARRVVVPSNEEGIPRVLTDPAQADLVASRLHFVPARTIVTSAHMQASLSMGPDPARDALAPDHRVWNPASGQPYPNLWVVDGSAFPESVGANPMQAIYTFARIAADRLAGE